MSTLRLLALIGAAFVTLAAQQYGWKQGAPAKFPQSRWSASMAGDEARGRVVLFGGRPTAGGPFPLWLNDTWEWDGGNWIQRSPAQSPSPREQAAMAYDSVRNEVILFGGMAAAAVADTWSWDGAGWSLKTPVHSPHARAGHRMAYHAARDEIVLFGGTTTGDTWVWDGTDWTEKKPAHAPSPRVGHAMAYDAARRQVVLFGGETPSVGVLNDTWAWDGNDWSLLSPSGAPSPRSGHDMAYDDTLSAVVLFGGAQSLTYYDETWSWDGVTWKERALDVKPPARSRHAMAYEPLQGNIVLFGGSSTNMYLLDTWVWSSGTPPGARFTRDGVVNAASYASGVVAPGELITVYGEGFGPHSLAQLQIDDTGKVATKLADTRVLFDGIPAPMIYSMRGQVSAIVPYAVASRQVTRMEVEYKTWISDPVYVPVVGSVPGIFTVDFSGKGQGAILNQDYSLNSPFRPASRGEAVMIYATGEGATDPPLEDGTIVGTVLPKPKLLVTARIGGVPATVEYAGGAPGLVAGVLQVNVRVPDGVTPGPAVPVLLVIGSVFSRPDVTMAVE